MKGLVHTYHWNCSVEFTLNPFKCVCVCARLSKGNWGPTFKVQLRANLTMLDVLSGTFFYFPFFHPDTVSYSTSWHGSCTMFTLIWKEPWTFSEHLYSLIRCSIKSLSWITEARPNLNHVVVPLSQSFAPTFSFQSQIFCIMEMHQLFCSMKFIIVKWLCVCRVLGKNNYHNGYGEFSGCNYNTRVLLLFVIEK